LDQYLADEQGEFSSFKHNRLDEPSQQIRLFRLKKPSKISWSGIEGTIETFDLDNCPPFHALSYLWGSEWPTRLISLNGLPISIRENLWQFLSHYQHAALGSRMQRYSSVFGFATYLWVDALSIDQANIQERNHQVQLMARIYRQAGGVLVWLGPDPTSKLQRSLNWLKPPVTRHKLECRHGFTRIARITNLEYWSRIWIVQEILLAQVVTVMCGVNLFAWSTFDNYGDLSGHEFRYGYLDALIRAKNIRTATRPVDDIPLKDALETWTGSSCADPRDKIFGLMGIVREEERIEVDYQKSVKEVFSDAVLMIAKKEKIHNWGSGYHLFTTCEWGDIETIGERMSVKLKQVELATLGRKVRNIREERWTSLGIPESERASYHWNEEYYLNPSKFRTVLH